MIRTLPRRVGVNVKYYESNKHAPLKRMVPKSVQDKLKKWFLYDPEDEFDQHQAFPAKFTYKGVKRITGFRSPSPGSQPLANVPSMEEGDDEFDIKYFSRDHLALDEDERGQSTEFEDIVFKDKLPSALAEDGPIGSPGNHYTAAAVKSYDPSGLRSAMTATQAEVVKALESRIPDHNVTPVWVAHIDEITERYTSRNLPPVPGWNPYLSHPQEIRRAAW